MERFENFVSNKLVKDELNTAMDANSLPHAIIIKELAKKLLPKLSQNIVSVHQIKQDLVAYVKTALKQNLLHTLILKLLMLKRILV